MSQPITKDVLDASLRGAVQEIVSHFNQSQGLQNEELRIIRDDHAEMKEQLNDIAEDVAKVKLAVIDLMATDRHLHNLVGALKREGIRLNEADIFAS